MSEIRVQAYQAMNETLPGHVFRDSTKRQQIMEGARAVFLERGFDGASVGDIVRAANVSKGTLYAYFESKEKLFETLVFEDRRKQAEALFVLDETNADPRDVLFNLGVTFLAMLVQPEAIAFCRMVMGAVAKFPGIGHAFYAAGPAFGTARLGTYLAKLTGDGVLDIADTSLAAKQFLDLCKSGIHFRVLLEQSAPPTKAEIERNVHSAVHMFFAAYAR